MSKPSTPPPTKLQLSSSVPPTFRLHLRRPPVAPPGCPCPRVSLTLRYLPESGRMRTPESRRRSRPCVSPTPTWGSKGTTWDSSVTFPVFVGPDRTGSPLSQLSRDVRRSRGLPSSETSSDRWSRMVRPHRLTDPSHGIPVTIDRTQARVRFGIRPIPPETRRGSRPGLSILDLLLLGTGDGGEGTCV